MSSKLITQSTGIQLMPLAEARQTAVALCYKLQPFCDRINIAGSIRRKKAFVKDIEIVCQPKVYVLKQVGLFGAVSETSHRSHDFITTVRSLGKVAKGKPDGRMMQIELQDSIMLDLFMPEPHDYYRQYAIRTGSSEYTHLVLAGSWLRKGWCGSDKGLRKISQCTEKRGTDGKSKWICTHPSPELPPAWESEMDFFIWLGVPWVKPHLRNM